MDAVLNRRSIRKYTDEEVASEQVEGILEAAMAAPSANNLRPVHLVVVKERGVLDAISRIHPYAAMASHVNLAIIVCADTGAQPEPGYYAQDCSAASENILIEATDQGLGSVWCGIHPSKNRIQGFTELLRLPKGIVPFSLLLIGHPAEAKEPHSGYEKARVHLNAW
jgi:nitroreductase